MLFSNLTHTFASVHNIVKEILKLCPDRLLVTLYKIPTFSSVDDFLQKVATVRGKLKKGGIVDVEAAARIILHDWNEGIHLLDLFSPTCKEKFVVAGKTVKNYFLTN